MMSKIKIWLYIPLFLIFLPGIIYAASPYASVSGAGLFHITEQTRDVWGDADNDGMPDKIAEAVCMDEDIIQGPDQDWSGTAQIRPGLIHYDNFLGPRDQCTSGWGGAASGGCLIVGFDRNFQDGDRDLAYIDYKGMEHQLARGVDFIVEGFGFAFNQAFSDERGTVNIYVADESYNPVIGDADPVTGLRTITGDESRWVRISGWLGRQEDNTWIGNPDHNYASGPGGYGLYMWGDIKDSGLTSARYIKFELGDGGHYTDPYSGKQNTGRALFADAVKSLYHCPEALAGDDRQVNMGTRVSLDGSDSEDADNDPLTFSWKQTGGETITLLAPKSPTPKFKPVNTGEYLFELTASDGVFQGKDSITITVVGEGMNQSPVASAGEDIFCNAGDEIVLDGSACFDPDNDDLVFTWEQVSGPAVGLGGMNLEKATFTAPNIPVSPVFKLTATDEQGLSDSDSVEVHINRPPIADGSRTDETATECLLFTLDASRSWDPDLDSLTYEWTQVSGPYVQLSDPTAQCPTFIVPEHANEEMKFTVTVSDGKGFQIRDKATVIIRELYIIDEDNPATSTWQVGSFSYRSDSLDLGKGALGFHDFTMEGKGDASGFPEGHAGSLTLRFNIPVADGEGCDLSIYHWGSGEAEVLASIDGYKWVSLGMLDPVTGTNTVLEKQDFDFTDFPNLSQSKVISVQFVKIVKGETAGEHHIDALVGHHTALTGIYASYTEESRGMVDWVDKKSDSGANAAGKPDYDDSTPGIGNCSGWMVNGGVFIAGYDNPFTDRGGPDLIIYHFGQGVTDKEITLGNTRGATTVEVSEDGQNWVCLGDLPLGKNQGTDLSVDSFDFHDYPQLGELDSNGEYRNTRIRYVRINKNVSGYTSGKFFDAIEGRFGFPGMGNPAGADITIDEGASVVLGRKNPARDDYEETTYIWKQVDNGAPVVVLSADDVKKPSFVAPMIHQSPITLVFELTRINEDRFGVSLSRVSVTITENKITGFDSGVATFINPVSGTGMGISCQKGNLVFYEAADPDYKFSKGRITDMENRPKNLDYGMINFTAKTGIGETAVIDLYLTEPAPADYTWFKYSKKSGWIEFMLGSVTESANDGAVISPDRKKISIHITDNGPFDDDDRDGIVNDPSGLGLPGGWHDAIGGSNGGGGCFIGNLFEANSVF
jgi:hypothetical protein